MTRAILTKMAMKITKELEQKIERASEEYRRENLIGAGQMTTSSWNEVYKSIGMTDKDIAEYREQMRKYERALNDPADAYRN